MATSIRYKEKGGHMNRLLRNLIATLGVAIALVACGGGGGGTTAAQTPAPTPTPTVATSVKGIAATGAAISGGTVNASCSIGTVPSTTTDSAGSYTLDLSNATLPCIIRVTVPVTGAKLFSIAESGATTANVTPLSHLLSHILFGTDSATVFASFSGTYAQQITPANIAAAQQKLNGAMTALGIDVTSYDALKSSFTASSSTTSGDALDNKLDQLMIALTMAEKSLTQLAASISTATTANIGSVTTTAMGPAATSLAGCPYVRSGNYWTFNHDGNGFHEWNIDFGALTANEVGYSTTYLLAPLTSSGATVNCAFTMTGPTWVTTAYFSKSGVFSWKQAVNTGSGTSYYFGLGVPVQTNVNLTDAGFAGAYAGIGYANVNLGTQYSQAGLPSFFTIGTDGSFTSGTCSFTTSGPLCSGATNSSSPSIGNATCSTNSQGLITCASADGLSTYKVFAIMAQQTPSIFVIASGTISGRNYTALMIHTKQRNLTLPILGSVQTSSYSWYVERLPDNNATASWTFNSGNSTSGTQTTVTAVDAASFSYTMQNGITWYLNNPKNGMDWVPTVTNGTYPSGSDSWVDLYTNQGWSARILAMPNTTTYDGIQFWVRKPI